MAGITLDRIRDLDDASDSIGIGDGTDNLAVNADGSINVVISGQSNVYAEDSAHTPGDDGNFVLALRQDTKASSAGTDGDYAALIQNSVGELYVTDEDVEALLTTIDVDTGSIASDATLIAAATHLEDSVAGSGDRGMGMLAIRRDADAPDAADGDYVFLHTNALGELKVSSKLDNTCNTSVLVSNKSVDTTVGGVALLASQLSGRREITVQNLGAQDIFVKNGTGVTSGAGGNGFEIPKFSSATYNWGDTIDLYAITASGTADVKIIECS